MRHHTRLTMSHGKSHTSASPYNYFGRTHDNPMEKHPVPKVHSGTHLRRGEMVCGPRHHGLASWHERGGGAHASYKD